MRFTLSAVLAGGLAGLAMAEDLLFKEGMLFREYTEATTTLGYTVKIASDAEWNAMTTADFAKFKAIIIPDPDCVYDTSPIKFFEDTKAVWSPAVTGNVVLIGTDPTLHSGGQPGAVTLIQKAVKFAASGTGTGLYFCLSCYYNDVDTADVAALTPFGTFTVRGKLGCYNNAHIVAGSPAIDGLTDTSLSGWSCSVHEAFASYPMAGVGGFQGLAIAKDILGLGSQTYGDGSMGLPYIISRGAIPAGCGNGKFEPSVGEECDHGSANGADGDLCTKSCKCLYGVLDAGAGTCKSAPPVSGMPSGYTNTSSVPYPTTTPSSPCVTIIGVEIIEIITIVEVCPEGSTVTTTITSCLSTLQRPIYASSTPGYPCYVCALGKPTAATDFITVTTTLCPGKPNPTPVWTAKMCHTCAAKELTTSVPGCDTTATACEGCAPYVTGGPHKHGAATTGAAVTTPGKVPVKPTTTKGYDAYFTGAAAPVNVHGAGLAAVVGVAAVGAALW